MYQVNGMDFHASIFALKLILIIIRSSDVLVVYRGVKIATRTKLITACLSMPLITMWIAAIRLRAANLLQAMNFRYCHSDKYK